MFIHSHKTPGSILNTVQQLRTSGCFIYNGKSNVATPTDPPLKIFCNFDTIISKTLTGPVILLQEAYATRHSSVIYGN